MNALLELLQWLHWLPKCIMYKITAVIFSMLVSHQAQYLNQLLCCYRLCCTSHSVILYKSSFSAQNLPCCSVHQITIWNSFLSHSIAFCTKLLQALSWNLTGRFHLQLAVGRSSWERSFVLNSWIHGVVMNFVILLIIWHIQ